MHATFQYSLLTFSDAVYALSLVTSVMTMGAVLTLEATYMYQTISVYFLPRKHTAYRNLILTNSFNSIALCIDRLKHINAKSHIRSGLEVIIVKHITQLFISENDIK